MERSLGQSDEIGGVGTEYLIAAARELTAGRGTIQQRLEEEIERGGDLLALLRPALNTAELIARANELRLESHAKRATSHFTIRHS